MANKKIGVMTCPVCDEEDSAQVGKSAKGFAYAVCENCGMQLFTRSSFAHARLMAQTKDLPSDEPVKKTEPEKKAVADPEPEKKVEPKKEQANDWEI